MSSPHPPQVKSNTNQTNSTALSWEAILKSPRIEKQHLDFTIDHIETAPQLPYGFVYDQFAGVKVSPPTAIAISGVGGIIGAVLVLKHSTKNIKYFVTTEDVINSSESSPLFLAKYALERLSKTIDAEVIVLKLNEFEKIKLLLQYGGIYVSGLPYELVIQISQLAGFGRLWHFSPLQRKFYVF